MLRIATLLAALCLLLPTDAGADAARPVLVELFTSQGCNACPPADAYLADLARRDDVIALSMHVDYWDYLGWRDPFAREACVVRQKAYRDALGTRMVYTPQMVVQGAAEAVGSDRAAVEALIREARTRAPGARLEIETAGTALSVVLQPGPDRRGGTLWVARYRRSAPVEITRGENAGRHIRYHNVVEAMMPLAAWEGQAPLEMSLPAPGAGQGVAVWLQHGQAGPILAVASRER